MNLNAVVAPIVSAVSPWVVASYGLSMGDETFPDGTRAPRYLWYPGRSIQAQPLGENDLKRLDGINMQEDNLAVYMNGRIEGVNRLFGRGGDLLNFYGLTWLVTGIIENWDSAGWTKAAVVKQVGNAFS